MNKLYRYLLLFLLLAVIGCQSDSIEEFSPKPPHQTDGVSYFFIEGFERGEKSSYDAASLTIGTGEWYLSDALIGKTTYDIKEGSAAVRIQNSGVVRMNFDVSSADTVTIKYASLTNEAARWELWMSTTFGAEWERCGQSITTSGPILTSQHFIVNKNVPVRFEVRKVDGGSTNRMNIDDFSISAHTNDISGGSIIDQVDQAAFFTEDFNSGSKTSYDPEQIMLNSLGWIFENANIISSAAQLINTGSVSFNFELSSSSKVSIGYSNLNSSAPISWQLLMSTDGGVSWTQCGTNVTSSSTFAQTVTFDVNVNVPVRFKIAKLSGGSTPLLIGKVSVTSHPLDNTQGTIVQTPNFSLTNEHLLLGNPSGALPILIMPNNFLMVKDQYVLSYSSTNSTANWVSWHLDATWLGSVDRQNTFRADPNVYSGWYAVQSGDYSGSGFDRGHLCPSADRTTTVTNNSATFFMTNMIPQAPKNNQGPWANLEDYCRTLVSQGNELYIIAGGYGTGGTGSNGSASKLKDGKINIPSHTWKVILVLPNGDNDLGRVTTATRTIAVRMPNTQSIGSNWKDYIVTVREVEGLTGLNFFSNVDQSTQDVIEVKKDSGT